MSHTLQYRVQNPKYPRSKYLSETKSSRFTRTV